jgi:hypothetical protein
MIAAAVWCSACWAASAVTVRTRAWPKLLSWEGA